MSNIRVKGREHQADGKTTGLRRVDAGARPSKFQYWALPLVRRRWSIPMWPIGACGVIFRGPRVGRSKAPVHGPNNLSSLCRTAQGSALHPDITKRVVPNSPNSRSIYRTTRYRCSADSSTAHGKNAGALREWVPIAHGLHSDRGLSWLLGRRLQLTASGAF